MSTVPNQKVLQIHKTNGTNEVLYTPIVVEAIDIALKTLSPAEFKVWMYIIKNKDEYVFDFSSADCATTCSISRSTCQNAINKMIELKYLTRENDQTNFWHFHDFPQEDKTDNIKIDFVF